jgi:hypothetical protein
VSNSSQSSSERSAAIFYYKNKEQDYIDIIAEAGKTKKETYEEYAKSLIKRIELKDDSLEIKDVTQISSYIGNKTNADEVEKAVIRRILSPLGCTDSKHDGSDNRTNVRLENLNEVKETLKIVSGNQFLETQDQDDLQDLHQTARALKDHIEFVAKNKGVPLVDHEERKEKISNFQPDPRDSELSIALVDLASEAYFFADNIAKIAKKVRKYPIEDPKIDKQRAIETRGMAQMFWGFNQKYLPSLSDDKYAFSMPMWYDVIVKNEQYSKHGAAVKSKVLAVDKDGKPMLDKDGNPMYRPLTREVVGDNLEETVEDMKRVAMSMDIMACLAGLVKWHDIEGKVINYTASRRIRVHDKLSETAFGAD